MTREFHKLDIGETGFEYLSSRAKALVTTRLTISRRLHKYTNTTLWNSKKLIRDTKWKRGNDSEFLTNGQLEYLIHGMERYRIMTKISYLLMKEYTKYLALEVKYLEETINSEWKNKTSENMYKTYERLGSEVDNKIRSLVRNNKPFERIPIFNDTDNYKSKDNLLQTINNLNKNYFEGQEYQDIELLSFQSILALTALEPYESHIPEVAFANNLARRKMYSDHFRFMLTSASKNLYDISALLDNGTNPKSEELKSMYRDFAITLMKGQDFSNKMKKSTPEQVRDFAVELEKLVSIGVPFEEYFDKKDGFFGFSKKVFEHVKAGASMAQMKEERNLDKPIEDLLALVPPNLSPTLASPASVILEDHLKWAKEGYNFSSDGIKLVTKTIETGNFDREAFKKIENRLANFRKGPYNSKTAENFIKKTVTNIPIVGSIIKWFWP